MQPLVKESHGNDIGNANAEYRPELNISQKKRSSQQGIEVRGNN
jgi:hypothetical protein